MVSEKFVKGKKFYVCDACKFAYKFGEVAKDCEEWCKTHHSCNLDITKHAVKL
ncbi:MAG TPA: hypothetical protein VJA47_01270 [archaeon]|nr:hypothetical protein [archaeon]